MKDLVIGIGFYRREQWPLLLESAVDAYVLEPTYDDWMDVLDSSVEKIKAQGIEPELVDVDVNDLLAYCNDKGIKNDGKARSMFIAKLTRDKNRE